MFHTHTYTHVCFYVLMQVCLLVCLLVFAYAKEGVHSVAIVPAFAMLHAFSQLTSSGADLRAFPMSSKAAATSFDKFKVRRSSGPKGFRAVSSGVYMSKHHISYHCPVKRQNYSLQSMITNLASYVHIYTYIIYT